MREKLHKDASSGMLERRPISGMLKGVLTSPEYRLQQTHFGVFLNLMTKNTERN